MKVYIAGTFQNREKLRPMKDSIWKLGHQCMSSWLDEVVKPSFLTTEEFRKKLAFKDCIEVCSSDLLILDTESVSGGKNCEFALALRGYQNQLLWTVGQATNIFQALTDRNFVDWEECLTYLECHYPTTKGSDANKI